jgi:aryl-alcohol dehydrogenase-like predicted oxidoreductase
MAFEPRLLGRTGLRTGALGISSSYGVPAAAVERAFEHGVNYMYFGSIRRGAFAQALRNLARQREQMILVVQTYTRAGALMRWSVERALRAAGTDYADVLLLGMWNKAVPPAILDAARRLRDRGLVRRLAVSTHNRSTVPGLSGSNDFDVIHFRYNAANNGAERDIFPLLPENGRAGLVSFTATRWGQLVNPKNVPQGERVPKASDCYRYVLSRPEVDVCLTGPSTAAHVDGIVEALRLGPMQEDELAWMRRVGAAVYGRK